MALTTCSECGDRVSDQATACPHCGAPRRPKKAGAPKAVRIVSAVFGLAIFSLIFFGRGGTKQDGHSTAQACAPNDMECLGGRYAGAANAACKPLVQKMAKYGMRWTDGVVEEKFYLFRWKDKSQQILTYLGDRAEFQNGLGNYVGSSYECDFATSSGVALEVRVRPGKL